MQTTFDAARTIIGLATYDSAQVKYDSAHATYDSAHATYNSAHATYDSAHVKYDSAHATYDSARTRRMCDGLDVTFLFVFRLTLFTS